MFLCDIEKKVLDEYQPFEFNINGFFACILHLYM